MQCVSENWNILYFLMQAQNSNATNIEQKFISERCSLPSQATHFSVDGEFQISSDSSTSRNEFQPLFCSGAEQPYKPFHSEDGRYNSLFSELCNEHT